MEMANGTDQNALDRAGRMGEKPVKEEDAVYLIQSWHNH